MSCRATAAWSNSAMSSRSGRTRSFPIFRHNGRAAEMVTAELAGAFEAPLYGMLAVQQAIDRMDWTGLPKPVDLAARPAVGREQPNPVVGR